MKILVVGGSGLIGGHAALHLQALGHDVTIAARRIPEETTALAELPFLAVDYVAADTPIEVLSRFDAVVFAAGNDIRHVPPGTSQDEHWLHANVEGVPRFLKRVRDAGVRRAVLIGSFYPQAAPRLVETSSYVRGRKLSDEASRALTNDRFSLCSLNAPFVVGSVAGLTVPGFAAHVAYARGLMPAIPPFAIPGGVNFISTRSLSEAVAGAIERGEPGKAYLVGDENLSFADYFGEFFRAAGRREPLPVFDREHPLLPDAVLYAGRGATVFYEPEAREAALLGYRRRDVLHTLREVFDSYR